MSKSKLPNKIINLPIADKEWHEQPSSDLGSFPHPFRICFIAPPNSGKSLALKNVLVRTTPNFEAIYLVHNDVDTKEYNDIDLEYLDNVIPTIDEFDTTKKNLLIIEDIDYKKHEQKLEVNS